MKIKKAKIEMKPINTLIRFQPLIIGVINIAKIEENPPTVAISNDNIEIKASNCNLISIENQKKGAPIAIINRKIKPKLPIQPNEDVKFSDTKGK